MGWFNKKKKEDEKKKVPSLSELPKLPEFPKIDKGNADDMIEPIHQLPSFPKNSLGEKFSQNTIKEAVSGKKEDEEVFEADDLVPIPRDIPMMQEPLRKPLTRELPPLKKGKRITLDSRIPKKLKEAEREMKVTEPIFIRIDKFEEGLQIFEKTKNKISEIEKMLRDIRKIKEEEEKELSFWENEMQSIKKQIEKIDQDIFSKIE